MVRFRPAHGVNALPKIDSKNFVVSFAVLLLCVVNEQHYVTTQGCSRAPPLQPLQQPCLN